MNSKQIVTLLLIAILAVSCVHASDVFDVLTDFIQMSDRSPPPRQSNRYTSSNYRRTNNNRNYSRQPTRQPRPYRNPGRYQSRNPRPNRNPTRNPRQPRPYRPVRNPRQPRPYRPVRNPRQPRPYRPVRNPTRNPRQPRPVRNPRQPRQPRPVRNPRQPRQPRQPYRPVRNPNRNPTTNPRRTPSGTVTPGLNNRRFTELRTTNSASNRGNGEPTGPGQKPSLGQLREQYNLQPNMRPPPRGINRGDKRGGEVAKLVTNNLRGQLASDPNARAAQIAAAMANDAPKGKCAGYVAAAIEAGTGRQLQRPKPTIHIDEGIPSAKDYGPSLVNSGYRQIPNPTTPRIGDVQVIPGVKNHEDGHMQIYTANGWVSDFNQGISSVDNPNAAYYKQTPVTYRLE